MRYLYYVELGDIMNFARRLSLLLSVVMVCCSISAQSPFNINLDVVRKSVVFLYTRSNTGQLQGGGTGFLMAAKLKSDPSKGYWLLVTARHIVDPSWAGCSEPNGQLFVTFNRTSTPSVDKPGTIEYPITTNTNQPSAWMFPDDDSVDLAVALLDLAVISAADIENRPLALSEIPTAQEIAAAGIGSQVTSAGLLLGAQGERRNYPLFKFGYISSIPEEKIPTACCTGCTTRAETEWLIAASLVPGNSGSPIYYVPAGFSGMSLAGQRPFLLGVQSTSFVGSDVAGMAPVSFLMGAIRKIGLVDADLPADVSAHGVPSMATVPVTVKPGPAPKP